MFLAQVAVANAATIASTFGPSDSYHENGGGLVGGSWERAFHFTVPSSDSYFLDGIEVAVGGTSQESTSIAFSLMSDSGGLPGATLESFIFSGITTTPFEGEIVSGQSSVRPTLLAGQTYWLAASAPSELSQALWKFAVDRSAVSYATRVDSIVWRLTTAEQGDDPSGAFRISGTVVPEPASSSLIVFAVLVFVSVNRKRSRRG